MKKIHTFSIGALVIALAAFFAFGALIFTGPDAAHAAGPAAVNLGTASTFAILSKTGITDVPTSSVTGNVGSSPITGAAIGVTCAEVTGTIYSVDAAGPLPCRITDAPSLSTAVSNMEAAYTDAAGRTIPDGTELYAGNLGGKTFTAGLYKWSTDVTIPASVTLSGSASDVWIFQIAGNLSIASGGSVPAGIKVILTGGAQASNVFWQVGGGTGATLGTYSTFNGTILSAKQVIIQTGAVLNGRALAQTQVTLDTNTVAVPTTSVSAALHVIKLVVNGNGGTAVPQNFMVHVKNAGTEVAGSPVAGTSTPGTLYTLSAGTYVVSEDANAAYVQSFSGACDSSGSITLAPADDKICTIINTDIPPPTAVAPTPVPLAQSGGARNSAPPINPLIGILKVPAPLALPAKGSVTYGYTVWNVGGIQPLIGVTVTDDKCAPVTLLSGDTNNNNKLDPGESWRYICATTLSTTTTNTAIATGYSDDPYHLTAVATAIATVAVGVPVPPPLIGIVKMPSRLIPFPFGGGDVTYSYFVTNPGIVPMHDVLVSDDKCAPVTRVSGDTNGNNLLDAGEAWTYTCRTHVSVSTRNIATAEGRANGFIAVGYAFATVLVSDPGLPDTGLPPEGAGTQWGILLLSGIGVVSLLLYVTGKKQTA